MSQIAFKSNTVPRMTMTTAYEPGKELSVGNASSALWTNIWVAATNEATVSGNVFVPQTPEAFYHDLEGSPREMFDWVGPADWAGEHEDRARRLTPSGLSHGEILTNDGRWVLSWDLARETDRPGAVASMERVSSEATGPTVASGFISRAEENRLVRMESRADAPTGSKLKLLFGYDAQGRRISKTVSNWVSGAWQLQTTNRFVYDGWNLLAEVGSGGSVVQTYLWGLDLSGSLQGAGGVGGLLKVAYYGTQTTNCFVAYDGNGNVAALVHPVRYERPILLCLRSAQQTGRPLLHRLFGEPARKIPPARSWRGAVHARSPTAGTDLLRSQPRMCRRDATRAVFEDSMGQALSQEPPAGLSHGVNAADGNVVARYEYGPFGEPLRATGPMAKVNPFRFSTKYQDDETDLLYYGYRFYNQSTGRWLNRDPIAERTGLECALRGLSYGKRARLIRQSTQPEYLFVQNNAVNLIDGDGRSIVIIIITGAGVACLDMAACWAGVRLELGFARSQANANAPDGSVHQTQGSQADALTHCIAGCNSAKNPAACLTAARALDYLNRRENAATPPGAMDVANNTAGYALGIDPQNKSTSCTTLCLNALRSNGLFTFNARGAIVLIFREPNEP